MKEITKNTYYTNTFLFDKFIYKNIKIVQIKKTNDITKSDYIFYINYLNKYYKINNISELLLFFCNNNINYIKYNFELNELQKVKEVYI